MNSVLQAGKYMQQWRFPNTYCFSKHLAELLMASYHGTTFPLAIVRPSIIGGLAGTPLPGYVGNTAGSTGAALAIATGQLKLVILFQRFLLKLACMQHSIQPSKCFCLSSTFWSCCLLDPWLLCVCLDPEVVISMCHVNTEEVLCFTSCLKCKRIKHAATSGIHSILVKIFTFWCASNTHLNVCTPVEAYPPE